MKYIVIEIQTNDGDVSTLTWQFDDLAQANAKYYAILSVAAVSGLDAHAAVILDERGYLLKNESFNKAG